MSSFLLRLQRISSKVSASVASIAQSRQALSTSVYRCLQQPLGRGPGSRRNVLNFQPGQMKVNKIEPMKSAYSGGIGAPTMGGKGAADKINVQEEARWYRIRGLLGATVFAIAFILYKYRQTNFRQDHKAELAQAKTWAESRQTYFMREIVPAAKILGEVTRSEHKRMVVCPHSHPLLTTFFTGGSLTTRSSNSDPIIILYPALFDNETLDDVDFSFVKNNFKLTEELKKEYAQCSVLSSDARKFAITSVILHLRNKKGYVPEMFLGLIFTVLNYTVISRSLPSLLEAGRKLIRSKIFGFASLCTLFHVVVYHMLVEHLFRDSLRKTIDDLIVGLQDEALMRGAAEFFDKECRRHLLEQKLGLSQRRIYPNGDIKLWTRPKWTNSERKKFYEHNLKATHELRKDPVGAEVKIPSVKT